MTRAEKANVIEELKVKFSENEYFYLADSSALTVAEINELRKLCFESGIEVKVVKNTLAVKALQESEEDGKFEKLYDVLVGPTTVFFTDIANKPAKIFKEFRKEHDKPVLKAAYIDSDIFLGDDQIEPLASLKSKDELIGDVILLLQSPAKNVISALKSSGGKLAGIVKTLQEREA